MLVTSPDLAAAQRTRKRIAWRLLPFLFLLYVIAFLDRLNISATTLSFLIGSPLAGYWLGISWLGLGGWRWVFILEGIPAIVFGVITVFYLTDWPREASWLRSDERDWITAQLSREKQAKQQVRSYTVWQAVDNHETMLVT